MMSSPLKKSSSKPKVCLGCSEVKDPSAFVVGLEFNRRGRYCASCVIQGSKMLPEYLLEDARHAKFLLYLLQIENPETWIEIVSPKMYFALQRPSAKSCLYCDREWGIYLHDDALKCVDAVLEHMDPLSLGGADMPQNVAISCATCNARKGSHRFDSWLKTLSDTNIKICREYYSRRHGRQPEQFVAGRDRSDERRLEDHRSLHWNLKRPNFQKFFELRIKDERFETEETRLQERKIAAQRDELVAEMDHKLLPFPWLAD